MYSVFFRLRKAVTCAVLVLCGWPLPVHAEWPGLVSQMEQMLSLYKTEALMAIQSDALWYYAWQVEGVDSSSLMQRLHAYVAPFDHVWVQTAEMVWEQPNTQDPCALRLKAIAESNMFVSLSCLRSTQPVHLPLLRHPALQLQWAWDERVAGGVVEHQWYSVQTELQPQTLLLTWLRERFPALQIEVDAYALSFEKEAEQWLLTWVPLGDEVGVYVLRWQ